MNINMKTKPKPLPSAAPCTPAEFEAFPLTVQRKCFSSVERLRIANSHSLSTHSPSPVPIKTLSTTLHRSLTLAPSSPSLTSSAHCRQIRRRRRHGSARTHKQNSPAHIHPHFFLSLPEKLQRAAFSREEQLRLLAHHYNHRQGVHHQHLADFRFHPIDDVRVTSLDHFPSDTRPSSPLSFSPTAREQSQLQEFDRSNVVEKHLHQLDMMNPPVTQRPTAPTYRRTLSLTNIPRRQSTSAPIAAEPTLSSRISATWHRRARSQSIAGRGTSQPPSAPVFDAEATHYRDPIARKKLRMYLASPQKFDEAVEFGFPSVADDQGTQFPHHQQLPHIATDARNFGRDMQSFLRDDRISFLDNDLDNGADHDSDEDSTTDDSPITPSDASFRAGHTRLQSSLVSSQGSTGFPSLHSMNGPLAREMTLRMTLTRPDLRADEEQLYGWQTDVSRPSRDEASGVINEKDPFALEELQLTDDMTGTKGPFYVRPKQQGNMVTRLFKRASKKLGRD